MRLYKISNSVYILSGKLSMSRIWKNLVGLVLWYKQALQQQALLILFSKFHIRTRHAHQVTALALAKLHKDAFMLIDGEHSYVAREEWKKKMRSQSPTFQYWDTILLITIQKACLSWFMSGQNCQNLIGFLDMILS